jgi:DNA-directed RNA polymerase specialized sigma24 family protein
MNIDHNLYRYTVELIKSYPYDRERLSILDEYLSAAVGPDPGASVQNGDTLATQDAVLERKSRSAEYRRLEYRIKTLDRFFHLLPNHDMLLVEMKYFRELTWREVAEALHVSEEACRKRRSPKIIARAAKMLFGDLC